MPTSPEEEATRSAVRPIQNIIKKRRRLNSQEASMLNSIFEKCPKPTKTVKEMIAKKLNMSMRCIQIWFQNRRAKARKDNHLDPDDRVLSFTPQSEPTSYSGNNWLISTPVPSPSASLGGEDPLFGEFFVGNHLAQTNIMLEQDIFRDPMITSGNNFLSTNNNNAISVNNNSSSSVSSEASTASSLFSPGLDPLDFGGFDLGKPNLDYFASKQESELFDEWTTLKTSRSDPSSSYTLQPFDFQHPPEQQQQQ